MELSSIHRTTFSNEYQNITAHHFPKLARFLLLVSLLSGLLGRQSPQPNDLMQAAPTTYPPPTLPGATEQVSAGLLRDAETYASMFGVSVEEALNRLSMQDDIGTLNARLAEAEAETFAGRWIQHEPEYRIYVLFTEDGEETISQYVEGEVFEEYLVVQTAELNLLSLEENRQAAMQILEQVGIAASSAIDVKKNQVNLYTQLSPAQVEVILKDANLQIPPRTVVIQMSISIP
jgi:hypothetical protein